MLGGIPPVWQVLSQANASSLENPNNLSCDPDVTVCTFSHCVVKTTLQFNQSDIFFLTGGPAAYFYIMLFSQDHGHQVMKQHRSMMKWYTLWTCSCCTHNGSAILKLCFPQIQSHSGYRNITHLPLHTVGTHLGIYDSVYRSHWCKC